MDMDETFAQRAACGFPWLHRGTCEPPAVVARDRKCRMRDQADTEPAVGQFAHHRIDQERHVVVDHLEDRDGFQALAGRRLGRYETDFRRAGFALPEEGPGLAREFGQFARVIGQQVFRRGSCEQQCGEGCRNVAEQRASFIDQRASSMFVLPVEGTGQRRWARIIHHDDSM
jgi:hypothetical protein